MTYHTPSFRTSRPDNWTLPRPHADASSRYIKHGALQPMDEPKAWWRIFA